MPEYKSRKSQSYKKSKNSKNSKSGGRRRKHTMRKYRRGKKVMRGGAISDALYDFMDKVYRSNSTLEQKFKNAYKTKYGIDYLRL